jgi:hypothetical protein
LPPHFDFLLHGLQYFDAGGHFEDADIIDNRSSSFDIFCLMASSIVLKVIAASDANKPLCKQPHSRTPRQLTSPCSGVFVSVAGQYLVRLWR